MIEVMQAYERGEHIQRTVIGREECWLDIQKICWNWIDYDYRVKPKYVPFDTAEEFLAAQRLHGISVYVINRGVYYAYVNAQNEIRLINNKGEKLFYPTLYGLFIACKFEDGTPCGKEVDV